MIGQQILDLIEAQIVMDEITGGECKHDSRTNFDMVILNHSRKWWGPFIMIDIECLFHKDGTGGQLKIGKLNAQTKEFFRGMVPNLGLRFYESTYAYTLYIEDEADEKIVLSFLAEIYRVEKLAV